MKLPNFVRSINLDESSNEKYELIPAGYRSRVARTLFENWLDYADVVGLSKPEEVHIETAEGYILFINSHTIKIPIKQIISNIKLHSLNFVVEKIINLLNQKNLYYNKVNLYKVLAEILVKEII